MDTRGRTRVAGTALGITAQAVALGCALLYPLVFVETMPLRPHLQAPLKPPPRFVQVVSSTTSTATRVAISSTRIAIPFVYAAPRVVPNGPPALIDDRGAPALYSGDSSFAGSRDGVPFGNTDLTLSSRSQPPPPPIPATRTDSPVKTSAPIRVGGDVQAARIIHQPIPVYPPLARSARISGQVKLEGIIGKDGRIQHLRVLSGHPLLTQAALDAVRQWIYKPTLLNGEPVEVIAPIEVNFTIGR